MKAAWGVVFSVLGVSCAAASGGSSTSPPLRPSAAAVAPTPTPAPPEPKDVVTAPAIPETPAGHTLQTWLDVFNSGDAQRIQAFATAYELPQAVLDLPSLHRQTGGFDLLAIQKSARLQVVFLLQERASPMRALGWIRKRQPFFLAEPSLPASQDVLSVASALLGQEYLPEREGIVDRLRNLFGLSWRRSA